MDPILDQMLSEYVSDPATRTMMLTHGSKLGWLPIAMARKPGGPVVPGATPVEHALALYAASRPQSFFGGGQAPQSGISPIQARLMLQQGFAGHGAPDGERAPFPAAVNAGVGTNVPLPAGGTVGDALKAAVQNLGAGVFVNRGAPGD